MDSTICGNQDCEAGSSPSFRQTTTPQSGPGILFREYQLWKLHRCTGSQARPELHLVACDANRKSALAFQSGQAPDLIQRSAPSEKTSSSTTPVGGRSAPSGENPGVPSLGAGQSSRYEFRSP